MNDENPASLTPPPAGYADWLTELKHRIQTAQQRATLAVNQELTVLYWQIGRDILARQAEQGWGAKVITRLSDDLRAAFPELKGFSRSNLKYMRAFAEAWPEFGIGQQPAGPLESGAFVQALLHKLPWFHLCTLLDKLKTREDRLWYAAKAVEHNWSRNILVMQIESRLIERSGTAVTNFALTLPKPQSDLARESLKDPYRFDFLGLGEEAQEREIENALVKHVTDFLLELGAGFAFVGRQVLMDVGGDEFFLDLLSRRIPAARTPNQPAKHRADRTRAGGRHCERFRRTRMKSGDTERLEKLFALHTQMTAKAPAKKVATKRSARRESASDG